MTISDTSWADGQILNGSDLKQTMWYRFQEAYHASIETVGSWFMGGKLSGLALPRMVSDIVGASPSGTRNMINYPPTYSFGNPVDGPFGLSCIYVAASGAFYGIGSVLDTYDGYANTGSISLANVQAAGYWSGVFVSAAGSCQASTAYKTEIYLQYPGGIGAKDASFVSQKYGTVWSVGINGDFGAAGSLFIYLVDKNDAQVQIRTFTTTAGVGNYYIRTSPSTPGSAWWAQDGGTETRVDITSLAGSTFRLKCRSANSLTSSSAQMIILGVSRGGFDQNGVVIQGNSFVGLGRMLNAPSGYQPFGDVVGTMVGSVSAGGVNPMLFTSYNGGSTFASGTLNTWFTPALAAGSQMMTAIALPSSGGNSTSFYGGAFMWRPSGNSITQFA